MRRLMRSDEGSSLAAIVMVLMVAAAIGVSSVQAARQSNDGTSLDRERLQAVNAAEAGVHAAMLRLQSNPLCDPLPSPSQDLTEGSYYRTQVVGVAGDETCMGSERLIRSWGYGRTGGDRAGRQLQVSVRLVPQDGFSYTLFAEGPNGIVDVVNDGIVSGDVYAWALDQTKNNIVADNVVSPGDIVTKNNASYAGTLWAGGRVEVGSNGTVGQSVLAAGGPILLNNNVTVGGDAIASGSVTLQNNAVVHGSVTQNSSSVPPPPQLSKPTFTWDPSDYTLPLIGSAAAVNTAIAATKTNLQGTFYAQDGGTVFIPNNSRITGDLTVVSESKIAMANNLSVSGSGHRIVFVSRSTAADSIVLSNNFQALSHTVLIYTLGGVDTGNDVRFTGAISADRIQVKNNFVAHKSEALLADPPPGFDFSESGGALFSVVPTVWREVPPDLPTV